MLIPLPLLLATVVAASGSDTAKKKAPAPESGKDAKGGVVKPRPASGKPPVILAGSAAPQSALPVAPAAAASWSAPASAPARQPMLGKAIEKSIRSTARSVVPRTSFLTSAIRKRAARGPALPPHIRPDPNSVPFQADSIVVEKSRRTMTLYNQGTPVRIYFIALGQNPLGDKVGIGDNRTPEGLYYIEAHNPASKYYLSLRVSYPNQQDIEESRARGTAPGGDIMIHGLPAGFEKVGAEHRQRDWTNGCIAVTNAEIQEIWSAIPDGAAIHIKP